MREVDSPKVQYQVMIRAIGNLDQSKERGMRQGCCVGEVVREGSSKEVMFEQRPK